MEILKLRLFLYLLAEDFSKLLANSRDGEYSRDFVESLLER
jgi:hypothetical protein